MGNNTIGAATEETSPSIHFSLTSSITSKPSVSHAGASHSVEKGRLADNDKGRKGNCAYGVHDCLYKSCHKTRSISTSSNVLPAVTLWHSVNLNRPYQWNRCLWLQLRNSPASLGGGGCICKFADLLCAAPYPVSERYWVRYNLTSPTPRTIIKHLDTYQNHV